MASVTADQAAQILLDRRKARGSFVEFCRYLFPDEKPAAHHVLLCNALDDVIDKKIDRLMVFMPPGSAKSSYTSVRFVPYFLGKFPKKSIICGSYSDNLSTSFGRKVRNLLLEPDYQLLFDTTLSEDSRAKGEWETNHGGSYFACGVGTGVTGRRADLALIDDPVKGRKEADSPVERENTWEWYTSDFLTRLKPGGAQIIIQTRWHEDDLSGRILPDDWNGDSGDFVGFDGQTWRVICIPAEARKGDILGRKKGEWLWPEWFTGDYWKQTKAAQTSKDTRNWTALYQQIPRPESGTFFQREWFKRYPLGQHPDLSIYGATDAAVTDKDSGAKDFTEHGVGGFDKFENLYFVDWRSEQVTMDIWVESQVKLAKRYDITDWAMEGGIIRRACEPYLKQAKRKHGAAYVSRWITSNSDKAANARAFQAMAADGRVYIPQCEWGDALVDQLVAFIPNTNFLDDKVDVCGLFGRILDQTYGPTTSPVEHHIPRDEYGFDETPDNSWKTL